MVTGHNAVYTDLSQKVVFKPAIKSWLRWATCWSDLLYPYCTIKNSIYMTNTYIYINQHIEQKMKRGFMINNLQCFSAHPSDSGPVSLPTHLPNSYLPKEPPPRATESMASMTLPLRGHLLNSSGSPHLGNMIHPPMPPSCIMEELQRAFASKSRQERLVHMVDP